MFGFGRPSEGGGSKVQESEHEQTRVQARVLWTGRSGKDVQGGRLEGSEKGRDGTRLEARKREEKGERYNRAAGELEGQE